MNHLSKVFVLKITATVMCWCLPLLLLPAPLLEAAGLPTHDTTMFVRMLGWAYLALCVGYAFGLRHSLQGRRPLSAIWVGIVSNGGAFACLVWYGLAGTWSTWHVALQVLGWASAAATLLITIGLIAFGAFGRGEAV